MSEEALQTENAKKTRNKYIKPVITLITSLALLAFQPQFLIMGLLTKLAYKKGRKSGENAYVNSVKQAYTQQVSFKNTQVEGLGNTIYLDDELYENEFGKGSSEFPTYYNDKLVTVKKYAEEYDDILKEIHNTTGGLTIDELKQNAKIKMLNREERILNLDEHGRCLLDDILREYEENGFIEKNISDNKYYTPSHGNDGLKRYVIENGRVVFLKDIDGNYSSFNVDNINVLKPSKWTQVYVYKEMYKAVEKALTGIDKVIKIENGKEVESSVNESLIGNRVVLPTDGVFNATRMFLKDEAKATA